MRSEDYNELVTREVRSHAPDTKVSITGAERKILEGDPIAWRDELAAIVDNCEEQFGYRQDRLDDIEDQYGEDSDEYDEALAAYNAWRPKAVTFQRKMQERLRVVQRIAREFEVTHDRRTKLSAEIVELLRQVRDSDHADDIDRVWDLLGIAYTLLDDFDADDFNLMDGDGSKV